MSELVTSPYLLENTFESNSDSRSIYNFLTHRTQPVAQKAYEALIQCCRPMTEHALVTQYGDECVQSLKGARMLLEKDKVWQEHDIHIAEIEIGTRCNWRCEYCPQKEHPTQDQVMPMELFDRILIKAAESRTIREISLNSYNEPTIDPFFDERVRRIADSGLRLCLYTNGSGLTKQRLMLLRDSRVLSVFFINMPSADPETFQRMTGSANWKSTFRAVDLAIEMGLPVELSVQGTPEDKKSRVEEIQKRWPGANISQWQTSDRLGLLSGPYAHHVQVDSQRLFGCYHIFHSICVDVHGNCFLCCNDYHKRSVYDSIVEHSFDEVLTGEIMQRYRRMIFGGEPAESSLLCRRCDVMRDNQSLGRVMRFLNPH